LSTKNILYGTLPKDDSTPTSTCIFSSMLFGF
jgi:hypothetical protein